MPIWQYVMYTILKNQAFATQHFNRPINILFVCVMNVMIISKTNNNVLYLFL